MMTGASAEHLQGRRKHRLVGENRHGLREARSSPKPPVTFSERAIWPTRHTGVPAERHTGVPAVGEPGLGPTMLKIRVS